MLGVQYLLPGKCTKKEKGSCPFLHDPDKVKIIVDVSS